MTPPVLDPWEDASAFPISVQDESELFSLWLFQKKKINALNPAFPKTICGGVCDERITRLKRGRSQPQVQSCPFSAKDSTFHHVPWPTGVC